MKIIHNNSDKLTASDIKPTCAVFDTEDLLVINECLIKVLQHA